MTHCPILVPAIVLVAWTAIVIWGTGIVTAIVAATLRIPFSRTISWRRLRVLEEDVPARGTWIVRDNAHLLEAPILFYASEFTLALSGRCTGFDLRLAWVYVAMRIAHSISHITARDRTDRFLVFIASSLVLQVIVIRTALSLL